jgi:hypothetical protein
MVHFHIYSLDKWNDLPSKTTLYLYTQKKEKKRSKCILFQYIFMFTGNTKRIFFRLSEIWNIFSLNMIKCHIFSLAVPARENMRHFIMLSDASCFARDIWRYIVTSRKQLFKRLYSVND